MTPGDQQRPSVAGRGCLSIFFLVFLAAGLFSMAALVREVFTTTKTRQWQRCQCTILQSKVSPPKNSEGRYALVVSYQYEFCGRSYESNNYSTKPKTSSDYAEIQQLVDTYPEGVSAKCFVDPENPTQAVLSHGSLGLALFFPLPLVFVAVGVGGIFFTWSKRKDFAASAAVSDVAISRAKHLSRYVGLFFSIFFVAGSAMLYPILLKPLSMFLDSAKWEETSCVIESSNVRSTSDSDGTTYLVDILYRYRFGGREYHSNRVRPIRIWSSGYGGKAATVARYAAGSEAICFVNPRDPREALLDRSFHWSMLFGLLPIAFMFVGSWGMFYSIRKPDGVALLEPGSERSRVLNAKHSRLASFLGLSCFALLWNGVVSIFAWHLFDSWRTGGAPWGLSLFVSLFVAIGLLIAAVALKSFLGLFSPRLRLVLAPGAIPLGESAQLDWQVNGGIGSFEGLRIFLEGREEADYIRGTNNYTDQARFAEMALLEVRSGPEMHAGSTRLMLPRDSMPTFKSANNRIIWSLHAEGTIRFWPDVKEEFEIAVLPPRR